MNRREFQLQGIFDCHSALRWRGAILWAMFSYYNVGGGGGALLPLTGGSRQVQAILFREILPIPDYQKHPSEKRAQIC